MALVVLLFVVGASASWASTPCGEYHCGEGELCDEASSTCFSAPETIEETVTSAIRAHVPHALSVRVTDLRWLGETPDDVAQVVFESREDFRGSIGATAMSANGQSYRTLIRAEIAVRAWELIVDVPAGQPMDGLVVETQRNLEDVPRDALASPTDWLGRVSRRSLSAGMLMRASELERPVVIQRQDVVTLYVRRGAVEIEDRGIAMSLGRVGESLTVRSLSSNATLTGICRGSGLVEIP